MDKACEEVDTVFHVAAVIALLGGGFVHEDYFQMAYKTNVLGTQNLLDASIKNNVKRFVHTSSADVCYNYENHGLLTEDHGYAPSPRTGC